jgi:hypothetical protein
MTTIKAKTLSSMAFGRRRRRKAFLAKKRFWFVIEAFIHNLDRQSYVRAARLLSLPYVPRRRNRPRQPVKMEPRSRRQKVVGFLAQRFFGKSEEDVSNAKMSAEAGFRAS